MELPQELEVWYIIPAIRKELALAMKNNGLKQVEIAKKLGLTKSAITQYINEKRGNEVKLNEKIKLEVAISANKINSQIDALREIQYLINVTREEKIVCQVHRDKDNSLSQCNVCFEKPLNLINIGERK